MLGFDETGTDYDDILAVADCLAESGHEVKILFMRFIIRIRSIVKCLAN